MKKTFPIILSSILAITVTSSVAHAETMYTNILLQNNQPSFPLVGITSTSTTAATTAKTTTPAKKAVQTTEHKLTWTGTYGKQPLSIKSVQETLKKYKQLPTQKPWNFAGKMVSDAKPIILECVNQYGKNLTVGAFAHCCGTGRTTLAPVQETYGRLTYDPKACQEMIETVIKIHNDSVKIQAETPVVTPEETATTADKIENTETTLSEKVQNQIKKNENENICLSMGVKSAEMNECKKDPDTYKKNKDACDSITGLSAVEINQCMKDPKAFAQKRVDEAACESQGLKKGTIDFTECKKDPATYKSNKEACNSITGLSAVEINQCMKDPKAFAQKRVNKANEENKKKELEDKCDALGAKSGANKKLCMEDPDKYSNAKSQCESMEAKGTNFNKCVTDPAEYKKTYELEKAAKEKGMNVRQYEKYMEEQEQLEAMRKLLG